MADYREFEVTGRVTVDREEVIAFLADCSEEEYEEDYEPTDAEYLACAYELFEKDEICWCESRLEILGD